MFRPDVIIVGAGIVGLAHALAVARRGQKVLVLERDAQANGASVRNFGFVTVTGQARGTVWDLARRSAEIWREIAAPAQIDVLQKGLLLGAQRQEAEAILEAFMETEMAAGCQLLTPKDVADKWPMLQNVSRALYSPHDMRIESVEAIPRLCAWLQQAYGVVFAYGAAVHQVESGVVYTSVGRFQADAIVVCPGDDWATLFPDHFAACGISRCKLQMLRLADPGWRLPSAIMGDLSLVRYLGYAELPEAAPLRARLQAEAAEALAHGVHLIVVQSADGSLVVGDGHHYAATPDPFASEEVDAVILRAFRDLFGPPPPILSRWTGTYASASGHSIVRTPAEGVRLVVVTSGTGASTSFALAEDVISDLIG